MLTLIIILFLGSSFFARMPNIQEIGARKIIFQTTVFLNVHLFHIIPIFRIYMMVNKDIYEAYTFS
jgi:hypothetical protein